MKLQEIFDHLSYGEFSQLSIGGAAAGVIDTTNYARVASHVQLGLTALYTRFNLKERRLSFPLRTDTDTYLLEVPDLLKVERVLVDSGAELSLNDQADLYGCSTPRIDMVRLAPALAAQGADVPAPLMTENIGVIYRANHAKILSDVPLDPPNKEVELPASHLDALLFYIAARVHSNIGANGEATSGSVWLSRYEMECKRLEGSGFQVQVTEEDTRFRDRGWV